MGNSDDENKTQKPQPFVDSIRIKFPDFYTDDPEFWFAQAESQFQLANVTSDVTKFHHVISVLPRGVGASVRELIKNPPPKNKYEALRDALTSQLTPSVEQRLTKLVDGVELGDRKPSEAYWSMKSLAGDSYSENLVRTLWLRRLPKFLYLAAQSNKDKSISDQLLLVDQIYEATGPSLNSVAHITEPIPSTSSQRSTDITAVSTSSNRYVDSSILQLTNQVASLQGQLSSVITRLDRMSVGRNRSPYRRDRSHSFNRRFRSGSRGRVDHEGLCYYHRRFGQAARMCRQPCKQHQPNVSINQSPTKNK